MKDKVDEFFEFVKERHMVYLRRTAGQEKPWTEDPILQNWRFCNVYRQLDKTTQYLNKEIAPHLHGDPGLLLFNIFLFRAFNWPETWEKLGGWKDTWDSEAAKDILCCHVDIYNRKLISSAYMIRGYPGKTKWQSIPDTMDEVWKQKDALVEDIRTHPYVGDSVSLQNTFMAILDRKFFGWGKFTAYEIVCDLRYTPVLEEASDVMTWASYGPGAKRGLRRIWPDLHERDFLESMRNLLAFSKDYIPEDWPHFEMREIEHSLCEFSKYMKVKETGRARLRFDGV